MKTWGSAESQPNGFVVPIGPLGPVKPVAPVRPDGPVAPVDPVWPYGPRAPMGPVYPVEPQEKTKGMHCDPVHVLLCNNMDDLQVHQTTHQKCFSLYIGLFPKFIQQKCSLKIKHQNSLFFFWGGHVWQTEKRHVGVQKQVCGPFQKTVLHDTHTCSPRSARWSSHDFSIVVQHLALIASRPSWTWRPRYTWWSLFSTRSCAT